LYGRVSHVYGKWGFLTVLWHVAPQNTQYLETAALRSSDPCCRAMLLALSYGLRIYCKKY
jgi:hypothetical protein